MLINAKYGGLNKSFKGYIHEYIIIGFFKLKYRYRSCPQKSSVKTHSWTSLVSEGFWLIFGPGVERPGSGLWAKRTQMAVCNNRASQKDSRENAAKLRQRAQRGRLLSGGEIKDGHFFFSLLTFKITSDSEGSLSSSCQQNICLLTSGWLVWWVKVGEQRVCSSHFLNNITKDVLFDCCSQFVGI